MAVEKQQGVGFDLRAFLSGRFRNVVDPIIFTIGLLVIWEVGVQAYNINVFTLPAPTAILETLVDTPERTFIIQEGITTTKYIIIALVAGCGFGVLSGFLLHYAKVIYRIVFPVLILGFIIPKIAIAPLFLLYFGTGNAYFILLPFTFVYFPVLENTLSGLRGVDQDLLDLSELYQPTKWFKFRHVQIPAALPYIGAGVKIGVTQATIGVVIAEIIAPQWGLGSLLMLGETYGRTTLIFATIFAIGIIGVAIYKIVEAIERRAIFWRETEGGAA